MTSADILASMTRDEMVKFLECWGFKCDELETAEELADAVAHTCHLEGIDLQQLYRLREALNVVVSPLSATT
jgi:hypothetical protein